MDRRKEELEKKRQKLAELRRVREERKQVWRQQKEPKDKKDLDELIDSLVDTKRASISYPPGNTPEFASAPHTPPTSFGARRLSIASENTAISADGANNPIGAALPGQHSGARKLPEFTTVETAIFDLPPKERVLYSKEAQTVEDFYEKPDPELIEEEIQKRIKEELEKEHQERQLAIEEERRRRQAEEASQMKELNDNELREIVNSDEFIDFVDYSTKIVERALNEKYDFMIDYTIVQDLDRHVESGNRVKLHCDFYDEKLLRNRAVMDVNWSQKYPELLVGAYNKNPMALNEPDGLVLVWNSHLLERPEFVFYSQSDVTAAMFSPFHPNLVVGGTYSGQILLWDTRARQLPVLKTPLSAVGHTHPVYSIQMVGTQNAYNFISASTDGLVCSWQLDILAQPQETLELTHQAHPRTDEIAVTTFGFPDNETTTFWVGTEEGNVYQANRYDRAGSKAGINQYDMYKGHHGCITGLHFHPLFGPADFSDLFLTSSVDWTIKLWRSKSVSKPSTSAQIITPVYSFEVADDYVYDVCWSPAHPALFASVDGAGKLDLWNLNTDTEVPTISTLVGSGKALNKVRFDRDGRKVACGSSDGHIYVYEIGELASPRMEEWTLFQKTVTDMAAASSNKEVTESTRAPQARA